MTERDCLSNPNFAVICSFMDRYAESLSLPDIGYKDLQEWIEDTKDVSPLLIDLHVRLLRRIHKKFSSVTADRWERGVVKFCYKYSNVDAWEIERFGYKLAKISTKLTLLKNLMESQFDCNNKFKDKINEIPIEDMRFLPVGRDKNGMAYWYFLDKELNLRVYREHQDDVDSESWELVCRNRDDLAKLITGLQCGTDIKLEKQESSDQSEPVSDINEDSRDSFKQKTPLGPSPLTIKQEPGEGEATAGDSKQPIVLKISKCDTQSPSKMLKDKFVKEKGSEIQKIMCKMKEEGLVDSDSGDDEEKVKKKIDKTDEVDDKTDEVDGPVNSEESKDLLKSEVINKNGEEEIDKTCKEERTNDLPNENDNDEKIASKNIEHESVDITDKEAKETEIVENSETDLKSVEESKKLENIQKETEMVDATSKTEESDHEKDKNPGEKDVKPLGDIAKDEESKEEENRINLKPVEDSTDKSAPGYEVKDETDDKTNNLPDKTGRDLQVEEINKCDTVKADKNGEAYETKSENEEKLSKLNSSETSVNQIENTSYLENKSDVVDVLDDKESEIKLEVVEGKSKEACEIKEESVKEQNSEVDKSSCGEDTQGVEGVDTIDSTNKSEKVSLEDKIDCINKSEKVSLEDKIDSEKDIEKAKPEDKTDSAEVLEVESSKDKNESAEGSETVILENKVSESQNVGQFEKKSSECSKEVLSEQVNAVEENSGQSTEIKIEDKSKKESGHLSENFKQEDLKSESEANIKRARKRKNDEIKSELCSSTDEEIENELVPQSKRAVKTAFRKSPNKTTDRDIKENESPAKESEKVEASSEEGELEKENKETNDEAKCEVRESEKLDEKEIEKKEIDEDIVKEEIVKEEIENGTEAVEEEEEEEHETEMGDKAEKKVKGLEAQSGRSKSKAQKRQAENSDDMEPAEPVSKKSKLRGRVSSKGRGKRRGVNFDSSSSDDDVPLSQMAGRGRGSNSRVKARPGVGRKTSTMTKDSPKKKKVEETRKINNEVPEIPPDLSEEDTGRRRSARVRNMRARKKSPSPDYVPSELEESEDEFDDDDDEFTLKSKKRKKKEPKEVVEELPKGRNALRHEAKTKTKGGKPVVEEEEEAACVKCLRSHQPEWILLCDKCDAGYHTACLRPPLMIIPDGDWFCPPCEHTMLKEKLEENLKTLDQAILKNDRLVRRKERLAFVSVSLDNVLKEPEIVEAKKGRRQKKPYYKESEDEESETGTSSDTGSSETASESESSSEGGRTHGRKEAKTKFIQRACRTKQNVSYRFEEFDELIMDAIEEDLSIPKEPKPRKVKPPGISRGKDMSNILGLSDEEATKKPVRKRRPRLTELDEEIDDDDTDDYQLSEASDASDATKSYESEEISEDSIESEWRFNSRSTRKSRRKGGRNRKYRDDFVVDSDFESDEDSKRRSKRRTSRRGKVNYREINSDETEVEDDDESFHSSELSDSDFETRRKKRVDKKKKQTSKERPRSGKRQRIRRVASSSESSETESEDSSHRNKKGKKPRPKTARYDSEETDESVEKAKTKKSKNKKSKELSDMSEPEAEGTEDTESSGTEVSESDEKRKKTKPKQKKTNVIKSDSEGQSEKDETEGNESHISEHSDGSGWEEIGVESDEENVAKTKSRSPKGKQKANTEVVGSSEVSNKDSVIHEKKAEQEKLESAVAVSSEIDKEDSNVQGIEPLPEETIEEAINTSNALSELSASEITPPKKKRGRKSKAEKAGGDDSTTTEEVTPKKRGRKPKAKPEPSVDETPVKKKRGRNAKSDTVVKTDPEKDANLKDRLETNWHSSVDSKTEDGSVEKYSGGENLEESQKAGEQTKEKIESDILQSAEKSKDDSPLSVRNKQNAPVGVVKPEVRQGVIVENKQVMDSRINENRSVENTVNPLQGLRDLAMGNQSMPGSHQSSFTPYSQSNYSNQNMQGFNMGQPGFQGYPHQGPPYSQGGPGPNHPYQVPQGMAQGVPPQYPPNQGPMSPNSYQQHGHQGSYMGQMQQGSQGFYPGNYRPPMSHPEGLGPPNPHGPQNPQYYHHPHQAPYQGQGYPDHPGHYMGPQVRMPHSQSGPGPYPGIPYNYPNMPPAGMQRPGYGPPVPQSMSPNQPLKPQTRLAVPPPVQQGPSPNPRPDADPPNRGFMMDNILKPSSEGQSNDVEDSAEVSDIDRYTSFLCKSSE